MQSDDVRHWSGWLDYEHKAMKKCRCTLHLPAVYRFTNSLLDAMLKAGL